MHGTHKLSQNRSAADKAGVIAALQNSPGQIDHEVALMMSKVETII